MATHSSILAWRIPRTEGAMGPQRVRHHWSDLACMHYCLVYFLNHHWLLCQKEAVGWDCGQGSQAGQSHSGEMLVGWIRVGSVERVRRGRLQRGQTWLRNLKIHRPSSESRTSQYSSRTSGLAQFELILFGSPEMPLHFSIPDLIREECSMLREWVAFFPFIEINSHFTQSKDITGFPRWLSL